MKKLFSLATIVATLLLLSCQKEDTLTPPQPASRYVSVAEAQQWFTQQFLPTRPEGRKKADARDPFWEAAQSLQFADGTPLLIFPIGSSGQGGYRVQSKEEPESDSKEVNRQNFTYLLVFKNEQGQHQAQVMKLLPDEKYLKQRRGQIRVHDFTGSMLVYDWEDNFITGTEYVDGKPAGQLKARMEASNGRLSYIPADCGHYRVDTYERFCLTGGSGNHTCTSWTLVRSEYYERECNPKHPDNKGGVTRKYKEYPMPAPSMIGDRPRAEYANKCQGIEAIWNQYPDNEVNGYIAQDGSLIVTDILGPDGGQHGNLYPYGGQFYYAYPTSQPAPDRTYPGMIVSAGYYLIPVVASVHTHTPCRGDGTDGVSHPVGEDDRNAAGVDYGIRHWVVGCGAVAQYDAASETFYNIQRGPLSSVCSFVQ